MTPMTPIDLWRRSLANWSQLMESQAQAALGMMTTLQGLALAPYGMFAAMPPSAMPTARPPAPARLVAADTDTAAAPVKRAARPAAKAAATSDPKPAAKAATKTAAKAGPAAKPKPKAEPARTAAPRKRAAAKPKPPAKTTEAALDTAPEAADAPRRSADVVPLPGQSKSVAV